MKKITYLAITIYIILCSCKKEKEPSLPDSGNDTPTEYQIGWIQIENLPFKDLDNNDWDLADGPDIYVKALSDDNTEIGLAAGVVHNVSPADLPIAQVTFTGVTGHSINKDLTINFFDDDTDISSGLTLMGQVVLANALINKTTFGEQTFSLEQSELRIKLIINKN